VKKGADVRLDLRNGLRDPTTVHWHGLVVPPEMDGHPADALGPGHGLRVEYPLLQRAGLNWYHPHPHANVASQVWLGLSGFFVINDDEEAALSLPNGPREMLILLRDARLSPSGNFRYQGNESGREGDFPLVNGRPYPKAQVASAVYRLRILNGANARVFRLASTEAMTTLIGNDGGLINEATESDEIDIGPAERIDVLLDLRSLRRGEKAVLRCQLAGWNLIEFEIVEEIADTRSIPRQLSAIVPLDHEGPPDRVFRFEDHRRINGQEYDINLTDFVVPFGKVERWRFESRGGAPHPIHVHGAHFQVQSREGGRNRVFPWEGGWKDTVLLNDDEAVEVLIVFDRYEGRYLLHCHKLEHEDHGMMMNFIVSRTPERAAAIADNERLFGPLCLAGG
jgi:FtsP/CotA-like multicopper oxidase with cupredoxin domain